MIGNRTVPKSKIYRPNIRLILEYLFKKFQNVTKSNLITYNSIQYIHVSLGQKKEHAMHVSLESQLAYTHM